MYPVLIDFGVYQLRAYGVAVVLAILSGVWVAGRETRRNGLDPALVGDAVWPIVLAALAGARLYFVAFHDPASYLAYPLDILAVWQGGLSVHGALLGGLLAAVWYVRRRRLGFWAFSDVLAPGLILGQTVARSRACSTATATGSRRPSPGRGHFADPGLQAWLRAQGQPGGDLEQVLAARYPEAYPRSLTLEDGRPRRVLEAVSAGVIFSSLEQLAADSFAVLRPRLPQRDRALALLRAFAYAGRPYGLRLRFPKRRGDCLHGAGVQGV